MFEVHGEDQQQEQQLLKPRHAATAAPSMTCIETLLTCFSITGVQQWSSSLVVVRSDSKPGAAAASCSTTTSLRHRAMQIVKGIVSATLVAMATVLGMYAVLGSEQNRAVMTIWFNSGNITALRQQQQQLLLVPAASSPAAAAAAAVVQEKKDKVHDQACAGKYIYIYDLPELFNTALFEDYCQGRTMWHTMCSALVNKGLGKPITAAAAVPRQLWYQTDQFALEVIIHERMKLYKCVTKDRSLASAFYLPYYIGLDIARNLFTPHIQVRDKLSHQFVGWLLAQPEWRRRGGADHVFVLGRVVWDFYRKEPTNEWGVPLLHDPELKNMTKLLIERDPYSPTATMVGIPYPTSFHPETDEDVRAWQRVVRESNRDNLVSFAGAPRKAEFHGQLRGTLLKQCMNYSRNCTLLDCSKVSCPRYPQFVTGLFLRSVFCLQPPGDSPTRKGIFDCLIAGCIPVFFSNDSAYDQYVWHLPRNGRSYSVFISEDQVQKDRCNVMEIVAGISAKRVKAMQEAIVDIIPGLVYAKPGHRLVQFKDAFDVIIDHLLAQSTSRLQTQQGLG
ncbi:unnamed protein product [Sphagnum troendelagicum]|uniref:Exostosin GT47 domain-containing protein n=1 Tax=Sphagnum troendelagicum TaxID=128251 RepID=A0ABP0U2V8_9BRYO